MSIADGWKYPRDGDFPPEGKTVETADSGGGHRTLVYERGLWWFPDRSMYVYFVPQSWRLIPPDQEART